jgi:hypothetical protein
MYYSDPRSYGVVPLYRSHVPDHYDVFFRDAEFITHRIKDLRKNWEEVRNQVDEWEFQFNSFLSGFQPPQNDEWVITNELEEQIVRQGPEHIEGYREVLDLMQKSLYALEIQCSFSTQMKLLEETKNLPGLRELHKHNYESSYHRTTALGCLYRILNGERHPHVFGIMIRCMIESEEHDAASEKAVTKMKQFARGTAEKWVQTVHEWLEQQSSNLREAMSKTRPLVGEHLWRYAQTLKY